MRGKLWRGNCNCYAPFRSSRCDEEDICFWRSLPLAWKERNKGVDAWISTGRDEDGEGVWCGYRMEKILVWWGNNVSDEVT